MKQKEYQFVFFLNIRHSFYSETELGKKHSHTWELEIVMHPRQNNLVRFRDVELEVLSYLERYQDKYLNTIVPFHRMNPSIENFLDSIVTELNERLLERDWIMKQIKIAENPTRSYMIDFSSTAIEEAKENNIEQAEAAEPETAESEAVEAEATEQPKTIEAEAVEPEETKKRKGEKPDRSEPVAVQTCVVEGDVSIRSKVTEKMSRVVITIP